MITDYTIKRSDGWYAVVWRGPGCNTKMVRGPFRWEWLAGLACWF